ncbi:MAG: restriction endonuclease subunit S [Marinifilaceae bacterium]|jgi:type I restriction enzyme S subunit|nr:restriction endonuclease subunit S [Marinifilaceae bacterium]
MGNKKLPEGWKEVVLGDIINFRRGHDLPKTKMEGGHIPVVGSNGIIGYHSESTTSSPCITIGRSGNVGNPHIYFQDCWAHNTTLYIDNYKGNLPQYIFYFLKTLNLHNYKGGSAVPTLNRNHIHTIETTLPPLAEQKKIAHILGKLDEKIELNRKMNETLEQMAQALFKSWFVDFDPVLDKALKVGNEIPEPLKARAELRKAQLEASSSATSYIELAESVAEPVEVPDSFEYSQELEKWIPKGWEVKSVGDLIIRLKQKSKYTKNNVLKNGDVTVYDQSSALILGYHNELPDISSSKQQPSFIFGDHTCITKLLIKPFSVGPNVIPLKSNNRNAYWTYFAIKDKQPFQEYRRHWMELKVKKVLTPENDICESFGGIVMDFYAKLVENEAQTQTLTQLRDSLLPKLISGELSVKELELEGLDLE